MENLHANKEILEHLKYLAQRTIDETDHFIPKDCSPEKYGDCMAKEQNWQQDAPGWGL